MQTIAITGSAGALGRRVVELLSPKETHVVGIDLRSSVPPTGGMGHAADRPIDPETWSGRHPAGRGANVEFHQLDLLESGPELKRLLDGAEIVIHLAASPVDGTNVTMARRLLDAASGAGVGHLVLLSSAAVYGAWPDNPVPLTESAPIRPNPGFVYAFEKAEIERMALDWRDDHPGATVTLLRPARVLGPDDHSGWLARATAPSILDRMSGELPSMQYLHIDDLAAAILLVAQRGVDGPFNVAPDGWVRGEDAVALLGSSFPIPLPDAVIERLRRYRSSGEVPGATPYSRAPWVIANDRLKALDWHPATTTEEAIVASRPPTKLARLFARRRQEITLAVVSGLGLATVALALAWWRRARRR